MNPNFVACDSFLIKLQKRCNPLPLTAAYLNIYTDLYLTHHFISALLYDKMSYTSLLSYVTE